VCVSAFSFMCVCAFVCDRDKKRKNKEDDRGGSRRLIVKNTN